MSDCVLRMRGLPFSAKEEDVIKFLYDVKIKEGKDGITFTYGNDGRASGEAYVLVEDEDDVANALAHHNDHMGKRYIEVFRSTSREMNWISGRISSNDDYVVRLRGLPYDIDKPEIANFFQGLEIAPNGIGLLMDKTGRSTGEAFVQFSTTDDAELAKAKHMEKIGHRYIEIFKSNMTEANNAIRRQIEMNVNQNNYGSGNFMGGGGGRGGGQMGMDQRFANGGGGSMMGGRSGGMNRPGPYNRPSGYNMSGPMGGGSGSGGGGGGMPGGGNMMRGNVKGMGNSGPMMGGGNRMGGPQRGGSGGMNHSGSGDWDSTTGHSVHLRGLPFSASEDDILGFLAPLQPVNIQIHLNSGGRPTGEADVDFASHDEAKEAMKKDREKIGTRYIELFLNSSPVGKMNAMDPPNNGPGGNGQQMGGFRGNRGMNNMGNNMMSGGTNDMMGGSYGGNMMGCGNGSGNMSGGGGGHGNMMGGGGSGNMMGGGGGHGNMMGGGGGGHGNMIGGGGGGHGNMMGGGGGGHGNMMGGGGNMMGGNGNNMMGSSGGGGNMMGGGYGGASGYGSGQGSYFGNQDNNDMGPMGDNGMGGFDGGFGMGNNNYGGRQGNYYN